MDNILKYLYYISILCFALPSGSVLGIPIKMFVTFGLLGLFFVWSTIKKRPIAFDFVIMGFLFILVALSIWACIGVINGYETIMACFKSFLSLLITVFSAYLLIKNKVVSLDKSIKAIYSAAFLIVVIKFACEAVLMLHIVEWNQFRDVYSYITGTDVTTMVIQFGGFPIYRIMATNDFLPLVIAGFYLVFENKSILKKLVVIVALGVYTFVVYSRVAMIQYAVIILFYLACLIWELIRNTTTKKMTICVLLSFLVVGVFGVIFVFQSETILSYISTFAESMYERWFGNSAEYSDSFRDEQSKYLWDGIMKTPILGQGLGSYVRGYIRSYALPFSYEAEYLSFIYQFGLVGFITIIGGIICIFANICFSNKQGIRLNLLLLINFGIWALRPLYNPQFLSSSSGMVIVGLFIAGSYYSQKTKLEGRINKYEN